MNVMYLMFVVSFVFCVFVLYVYVEYFCILKAHLRVGIAN